MTTVAIYFDLLGEDAPPFDNPHYVAGYLLLGRTIEKKGGKMLAVRGRETYLGGGRFTGGWLFRNNDFVRVEGEVAADVIYNKGEDFPYALSGDTRVVNCEALQSLCRKDETYARFPQFTPLSIVVHSPEELESALARMPPKTVVLKPPNDSGGRGVIIGPKAQAAATSHFPCIVQEFIDTSGGIPGITPGAHDLRVTLIGGEHALTFVRVPKAGSLIANIAQGGSAILLDPEKIPKETLELALAIDREIADIPDRVYCVDMGRDKTTGAWKLIELNSPPGLPYPGWGTLTLRHYELLSELLLKVSP